MSKTRIVSLGTDRPEEHLPKAVERFDADYRKLQASSPEALAVAAVYWKKYPRLASLIGDDRREENRQRAYDSLNRTHRKAAEVLCRAADKQGIDGAAIYSAAEICRELFRDSPAEFRDGEFQLEWPECVGTSRKALATHDQETIRVANAAYVRLVAALSIPSPASTVNNDVPYYVTLQQIAACVNRSKRTLEGYRAEMPAPVIPGGKGQPAEWNWDEIRPWLEKTFQRPLWAKFPADRFRRS